MTLAGTRPILQDELLKYELHHRARIAIKPGITGMFDLSMPALQECELSYRICLKYKVEILKDILPLIFLVCALGYSGVILNRLDYDIRGLGLDRQALGFTHPNNLGAMMMVITIYLFYKKHKNFGVQDYLFLLFADYICWSVAVSRTSSIIITGVILVECLDSIVSFL